jgi:hypothetical protein
MPAPLVVLALLLVSAALGSVILWVVGLRTGSPVERFGFATGLGLGLFALAVMYVALNGEIHSPRVRVGWTGGLAVFGAVAVALIVRWTVLAIRGGRPRPSGLGWVFVAFIVLSLAATLLASLAPPTDPVATAGPLRIAHRFLERGGTVRLDDFASNAPLNAVMLYLPLMKLGGDVAPGVFAFACLLLTGLAVYAAARDRLPVRPALLASAAVAAMPVAAALGSDANAEILLTLFTTLAFTAFARWWDEERAGWLVLSAAFVGFALGTSILGLFALVLLLVGVVAKAATHRRWAVTLLSHGAAALLLASLVGAPWYARNARNTGNPFYPLLADVIPTRHVSSQPAEVPVMQARSDYPLAVRDVLVAPVAFTVGRDRGIFAPPSPRGVTHSPGLLFLAFVPLVLVLRPRPAWAKLALGSALLGMLLVMPMAPLPQYVLPFAAPAALCVGHAFERLERRRWSLWTAGVLAVAALLLQVVPILERAVARGPVVFGAESRSEYVRRADPAAAMAVHVAHRARGLPVLVIGERLYPFLARRVDATLGMPLRQIRIRFEDARSPADLLDQIRAGGYAYVVVNEPLLDRRAPFALDLLRPLVVESADRGGLLRLGEKGPYVLYLVTGPDPPVRE